MKTQLRPNPIGKCLSFKDFQLAPAMGNREKAGA